MATRRWNSYISAVRWLNTYLSDNILASAKPHTPPFCGALSSQAIKSYFRLRQKLITQNSSLLILGIPEFPTLLIHHLLCDGVSYSKFKLRLVESSSRHFQYHIITLNEIALRLVFIYQCMKCG